ncbi:Ada metal-binding domain-containing protein [Saxibacter everestensis]|uniref:DNA-3-methyladenine glycosylase II n=1 Tax=Saxibacter everestensis TaxID=2909229 RepID=A0ABY8QV44_9MICO|nr:Ada metal-binding domain-containing protein [Brevibacteriaceae bacterium ZFBP1038]
MQIEQLGEDGCVKAVQGKDARFDGRFYTAVLTTGIYCRPSCPARTPLARNMRFYPSAAAAQAGGFRACKRCRPDATPGAPDWNLRSDLVARAVRLISDGVVDREGVGGLARRLGYSVRQIERQLYQELGATPLALARAQRAQTARVLLESTDRSITEIAFSAGFNSIRSFNDTMTAVYAMTPGELRRAANQPSVAVRGSIALRLPFRKPLNPSNLFGHLVATGVPGIEGWHDGAYRATLRLPRGTGIVALRPQPDYIVCTVNLADVRDLAAAISRCRWLLDLDADPELIDSTLAADPALAPLIDAGPGRRVPRILDGEQFAIRAVLGQQVSTAAARTHAWRLVEALGEPVDDPDGGLTHVFPTAAAISEAADDLLAMPARRRDTVRAMARALAAAELELGPGADWGRARDVLATMPGIGPWTIESIAMRALGDPDAFIASDLGIKKAAVALGLPTGLPALQEYSLHWRPFRAYAVQYLWTVAPHAINQLPGQEGQEQS